MKKWYVIQVVPGNEDGFRRDLLHVVQEGKFSEVINDVVVPTRKKNPEDLEGEKIFPGYVLVSAEMSNEVISLISRVPRYQKFVGGLPPVSLKENEVRNIFDNANKLMKDAESMLLIGGEVKITKGPFSGFPGIVESVDEDGQKVRLSVSIFGRMTSIAVDADQIEVVD